VSVVIDQAFKRYDFRINKRPMDVPLASAAQRRLFADMRREQAGKQ
jgi:hypothetical protein